MLKSRVPDLTRWNGNIRCRTFAIQDEAGEQKCQRQIPSFENRERGEIQPDNKDRWQEGWRGREGGDRVI